MTWLSRRIFGERTASVGAEARASIEMPGVTISSAAMLDYFGGGAVGAGVSVTPDAALGLPALWAAVNFLSGTIAGLPLHLYRRGSKGRERVENSLADIVRKAPTPETSSFDWRKRMFDAVFLHGRGISFIERAPNGLVTNIWPLDPTRLTVERVAGLRLYHYQDGLRRVTYEASEVIDIPWMLKPDGLASHAPMVKLSESIGRALAAQRYAGKFFNGGGVPAFALIGNFVTPGAMERAANDVRDAILRATAEGRNAISLPAGVEIKPLGVDPDKMQLLETQRFAVEDIARIYNLPPVFVQDLTHGTFSNTEQQDLHFVKHTVRRWVTQFEQEINLKLFGRSKGSFYVEFDLDGLMRGDFVARMSGYATGIQNGILTPNEARAAENRSDDPSGGSLMMQGATVPLSAQQTKGTSNAA
jgi:HK97 family phage portal protein